MERIPIPGGIDKEWRRKGERIAESGGTISIDIIITSSPILFRVDR